MARITFFDALGNHGLAVDFYDAETLAITDHTDTTATMADALGARVEFVGSGLILGDDGAITGGIITAITLISASGDLLTTVTGLHKSAPALWASYQAAGLLGVEFDLIKGDDRITGSGVGDYMLGLSGDDRLVGLGGRDAFLGGTGDDTMVGGGGADLFVFGHTDKQNHDVIIGFHAEGPKSEHDKIYISAADAEGMVMEQVGKNVLISWAWGGDLLLKHLDLAKLGENDFHFG